MTTTFTQLSTAFDDYSNHIELNSRIYDTIRTNGMSRGFMHFLNCDDQLNKLFSTYKIGVKVPAVESFNMVDTIDSDSESLVAAFESLLSTTIKNIRELWSRIVTFIKKMWRSLFDRTKQHSATIQQIKALPSGTLMIEEKKSAEVMSYDNATISKMEYCIRDLITLMSKLTDIVVSGAECGKNEAEAKTLTSHLKAAFNIDVTVATKNPADGYIIDIVVNEFPPKVAITGDYVSNHRLDTHSYSNMISLIDKFQNSVDNDAINPAILRAQAQLNENNMDEIKKIIKIINCARNIKMLQNCTHRCVAVYIDAIDARLNFELSVYTE